MPVPPKDSSHSKTACNASRRKRESMALPANSYQINPPLGHLSRTSCQILMRAPLLESTRKAWGIIHLELHCGAKPSERKWENPPPYHAQASGDSGDVQARQAHAHTLRSSRVCEFSWENFIEDSNTAAWSICVSGQKWKPHFSNAPPPPFASQSTAISFEASVLGAQGGGASTISK